MKHYLQQLHLRMDDYKYVDADTGQDVTSEIKGGMPSSSSYIPSGGYNKNDRADLLDKISPERVIPIFKNYLMGYEWDEEHKVWKKNEALQTHALTEVGASRIASLMLGASTKNVSISGLKDHEIKARLLSICKTAQYMALENWKEFGIKHSSQFHFIHEIVMTNTLVVLKQPENDGIKKLLAGTVHENRNVAVNEDPNKKRLFGVLKR